MNYNKILTLCITLLVLSLTVKSLEKKTRVMLIGIDGLLMRCLEKAKISAFVYMAENGSFSLNARTTIEAVSGPGWSNILCGMDTESSGVTNYEWVAHGIIKKAIQ